jgi:hypothetical protein
MIGALDKSIAGYRFGWEEQRNGCRRAGTSGFTPTLAGTASQDGVFVMFGLE